MEQRVRNRQYGELLFDKGTKVIQWRKDILINFDIWYTHVIITIINTKNFWGMAEIFSILIAVMIT